MNEITFNENKRNNDFLIPNEINLKDAVKQFLDEAPMNELRRKLYQKDTLDYSSFNDLEMMYLYIHEKKDQDEEKNRTLKTKQEYARELLWTYGIFVDHAEEFGLSTEAIKEQSLLRSLRDKHIHFYQEWLRTVPNGKGGKPYSIATISRKTIIWKSFLSYIYKMEYVTYPVHQAFLSAKVAKKDRPNRDIMGEEVIQLLDYYRDHPIVYGFLSVLVTTGARISEICPVKVSDITYDYKNSNYWMEVTGKGNKKRDLLIHSNVWETIVRFRARRGLKTKINPLDHSPLFVTAKGKAYHFKNLSKYLKEKINQADVPFIQANNELQKQLTEGTLPPEQKDKIRSFTPHTLRHGFAIISAENKTDIFRIMQALGHEKIETTQIYLENKQSKETNAAHDWKNNIILKHI